LVDQGMKKIKKNLHVIWKMKKMECNFMFIH